MATFKKLYEKYNNEFILADLITLVDFVSSEQYASIFDSASYEKLNNIYLFDENTDIFTFFYENMNKYEYPETSKGQLQYDDVDDFIDSMTTIMTKLLENGYNNKTMINNILDTHFTTNNVYSHIFKKVRENNIEYIESKLN